MPSKSAEHARLDSGLQAIRPLLASRGFTDDSEEEGSSSGGPFAATTFRRGPLTLGLIVRNRDALGCPNYSAGEGYVGHADLVWSLGAAGTEELIAGDWLAFQARSGGDPFIALQHDLEHIVLPALDASEEAFLRAVARAREHLRKQRGW